MDAHTQTPDLTADAPARSMQRFVRRACDENSPRIVALKDIKWCKDEIAKTKLGGHDTAPYTAHEWIECMKRRIAANARIIEAYGGKLA